MKIHLHMEAENAGELMAALAVVVMQSGFNVPRLPPAFDPKAGEVFLPTVSEAGGQPVPTQTASEAIAAETVKKTRAAKPKPAETPTDPAPQSTAAEAGGEAASSSTAAATSDEPPAITIDEVRNSIIDLLNDWSEAKKDDPEIRTKVLGPMLVKLGANKIKNIDPKDFRMAFDYVDESRKALNAFKEGGEE